MSIEIFAPNQIHIILRLRRTDELASDSAAREEAIASAANAQYAWFFEHEQVTSSTVTRIFAQRLIGYAPAVTAGKRVIRRLARTC